MSKLVKVTVRLTPDQHEKLRWLAFKGNTSQQELILQLVRDLVKDVKVPKEIKE